VRAAEVAQESYDIWWDAEGHRANCPWIANGGTRWSAAQLEDGKICELRTPELQLTIEYVAPQPVPLQAA